MTDHSLKKDLLSQLLSESQAYRKFEDIEKLVESGDDLSVIPIQPLFVSLQTTSTDQIAQILPRLSSEQRQALRDIDLWKKELLDPEQAIHWLDIYSKCPDEEVIMEFVKSEDFLLSLKNLFTIYTFDVEDPQYPEHDNYFLTEDNLLLVEYPEDFNLVQELKQLIRRLYGEMGVERAYAFLFKMVVDSYMTMEEQAYQEKVERLRDYGFVDYYEAGVFNTTFSKLEQIDAFISSKKPQTGSLDAISRNQNLHASTLVPYQSGMDGIREGLEKITNDQRGQYLQFNFIRLVNARMTLEDGLKNGSLAMGKIGQQTRQCLELGHDYIQRRLGEGVSLYDIFDFQDVYKVGRSLLDIKQRQLKKALSEGPFESDEFSFFLGSYWNAFLENSFDEVTKYKFDGSTKASEIKDVATWKLWGETADTFITAVPYIQSFLKGVINLKTQGLLNDQFYLNYEVDNIDFEAIMISSLVNYAGGFYQDSSNGKMGVTISELRSFYHKYFHKKGEEYLIKGEEDPELREKSREFITRFGMDKISGFDKYLYQVLVEQLNGYEIDGMSEDDFRHVGGPIILNSSRN